MFQKVQIIGRLGRDPELRYTPSGQQVTSFSVATERQYSDSSNKQIKETTWWNVRAWGTLAEACERNLGKGRLVMVEGRMNIDPKTGGPKLWRSEDSTTHANFEITAGLVKFLTPTSTQTGEPVYSAIDDSAPGEPNDIP